MASPIPDTLPFEDAAVLPLAVSTAACGLFQTDQLGLRHPSVNAGPTGETLLVWGGSTSVGSNAIQLAAAPGYGSKFVSIARPPVSFDGLADDNRGRFELPRLISSNVALQFRSPSAAPAQSTSSE